MLNIAKKIDAVKSEAPKMIKTKVKQKTFSKIWNELVRFVLKFESENFSIVKTTCVEMGGSIETLLYSNMFLHILMIAVIDNVFYLGKMFPFPYFCVA